MRIIPKFYITLFLPNTTHNYQLYFICLSIDMIKDAMCVLNILSGVPTYQNDPDKYCKGELSDEALVFETQQCGIYFKHTNWQTPQHVFVTGASDNKVNVKERLAVLQLYQDADKGSTNIKELNIWNGIMLPEIKVLYI